MPPMSAASLSERLLRGQGVLRDFRLPHHHHHSQAVAAGRTARRARLLSIAGRTDRALSARAAALLSAALTGAPGFVVARTSLGRALFAALTFHLNQLEIAVGYLPAAWDVLWSLSLEEVFYLAYPLLLRFAPRPWLVAVSGALLIFAGPLARTVGPPAIWPKTTGTSPASTVSPWVSGGGRRPPLATAGAGTRHGARLASR